MVGREGVEKGLERRGEEGARGEGVGVKGTGEVFPR